jgi:Na+/H+ antiporter NhaA
MPKNTKYAEYDLTGDGKISAEELAVIRDIEETERATRKQKHQRNMAWVSLFSMIGFTIFMFMPFVPDERIELLSDVSNLFYLAQAGIVGAFMGFAALEHNKKG